LVLLRCTLGTKPPLLIRILDVLVCIIRYGYQKLEHEQTDTHNQTHYHAAFADSKNGNELSYISRYKDHPKFSTIGLPISAFHTLPYSVVLCS